MRTHVLPRLVAAALLVAGTERAMAVEPERIAGSWRLESIDGRAVEASGAVPSFTIEGRTISGYDGCNRFGGSLDAPEAMIVGQRACAGDHLALPLDLADPLADLAAAELEGDRLVLPARGSRPAATFVRAE